MVNTLFGINIEQLNDIKIMRRLFIAAAAMFLAAGFVACDKNDDASVAKDIKVEFSVAAKDGFNTTRAVKSDWADGDQILILFRTEEGNMLVSANSNDNTITLTYDAGTRTWELTKNNWGDELINSSSGGFLAVHYRGTIGVGEDFYGNYKCANFTGGEVLKMQGQYTIADGIMTLPELALTMQEDIVQFSVKDLATDTWQLLVTYDMQDASESLEWSPIYSPVWPFNANMVFSPYGPDPEDRISIYLEFFNQYWMAGVRNGGDLSFCGFILTDKNNEATANYMFILNNTVNNKKYYFNYQPSPFVKFEKKNAYRLPPLTLDSEGTPTEDCLWSALE